MSTRVSTIQGDLERAIVQHLDSILGQAGYPIDVVNAPAQKDAWRSKGQISCRVVWIDTVFDRRATGATGVSQERTTTLMLRWEFKQLKADLNESYRYLEAARTALHGWVPRRDDGTPLSRALVFLRERLFDVEGAVWIYQQTLRAEDTVSILGQEDELGIVTRVEGLMADGSDFDPAVDTNPEGTP